jgi:hypothetical protein
MTNEVADLLDALHQGSMTLDEVAERFRHRSWPTRKRPQPRSFLEAAAADLEDPDPYIPGSYDDVVAAYDRGQLTDDQYAVLAKAIADATTAE